MSTQTTQRHRYVVTVTGCDAAQAEQVMAERLCHEEDYGFAYEVGYEQEAAPSLLSLSSLPSLSEPPIATQAIKMWTHPSTAPFTVSTVFHAALSAIRSYRWQLEALIAQNEPAKQENGA